MGHPPERVTVSVYREGEVRYIPEGGGRHFGQDPELGTASVAGEGEITNSGYLTFFPGGISTINRRPIGGQVSESTRAPRGYSISETSHNTTGSSAISTPEDSCKILIITPRL